MAEIGKHPQVFEYDGSFKCIKCQCSWGALPGKPEMPDKCELSPRRKRIMDLESKIRHLQAELTHEQGRAREV